MRGSPSLPVIAFTLGDPGGVGPEVILRTLDYFSSSFPFIPVVFGSLSILEHPFLYMYVKHKTIKPFKNDTQFEQNVIYFHDSFELKNYVTNEPHKINGEASYTYINEAVQYVSSGKIDALVTGPICKESFQLAGLSYTGHTTLLKDLTNSKDVSMLFYTPSFNVILATIHLPLKEVSSLITESLLKVKIEHAVCFEKMLGKSEISIGVAGLNPHAGEHGLFGTEEQDIMSPLVDHSFFGKGVVVSGPYSADTVFYRAKKGDFDCVLAMYHDQGLIPVKLNHFFDAVNVTMGLPIIRTSPDHGTAFDRAYEHLSSIESMLSATRLAMRVSRSHV